MNRHALTYIEMYPEPVNTAEPSGFAIWAGAALCVLIVWALTFCAFSL